MTTYPLGITGVTPFAYFPPVGNVGTGSVTHTTGSIRIIGCHVDLTAQTRVVGAAESSPLDVTVMATTFAGATTRQAFTVTAGTVRFVDCEAP